MNGEDLSARLKRDSRLRFIVLVFAVDLFTFSRARSPRRVNAALRSASRALAQHTSKVSAPSGI